MKNKILLIILIIFTSCELDDFELPNNVDINRTNNYFFKIIGNTYQDSNNFYHLNIDDSQLLKQTLHRFGAHVTNTDKYGLPTKIFWRSNTFWYLQDSLGSIIIKIENVPLNTSPWNVQAYSSLNSNEMTVPIVNGTSYADPIVDSAFCIMAPIGAMVGDTSIIYGQAWFEEGDIILRDTIQIIFE